MTYEEIKQMVNQGGGVADSRPYTLNDRLTFVGPVVAETYAAELLGQITKVFPITKAAIERPLTGGRCDNPGLAVIRFWGDHTGDQSVQITAREIILWCRDRELVKRFAEDWMRHYCTRHMASPPAPVDIRPYHESAF